MVQRDGSGEEALNNGKLQEPLPTLVARVCIVNRESSACVAVAHAGFVTPAAARGPLCCFRRYIR